ncbi:MAG: hypothetical protein H0T46_25390 [Deltaproteobacteria bacterium]|nr:hypothetical protein [Deltaproteobacteria bacterium]
MVLLLAGSAYADRKALKTPIDIKPMIEKLDVYKDDVGNYFVTPKPLAIKEDIEKWVFYGTGKAMYQQRIIGSGVSGDELSWAIWSPRVKGLAQASVTNTTKGAEVRCKTGEENHQKLVPLAPDQAKAVLMKATFYPPLWERSAHFLARDDDGVYFYVDIRREEYGGKGHRVFMGKKGSMKELSMTNIVSDSAGEIYSTKSGELKIVAGADGKAFWKKGSKKVELVVLEPARNRYVIYRDLGIYGSLGVVCDEQ